MTQFVPARDGSGLAAAGDWALAVDYSRASGADALIVTVGGNAPKGDLGSDKASDKGSEKARATTVNAGNVSFNVLTLSATGKHPEARAEGGKLVVGGQTLTYADGKLTLSTFQPRE